jgi:NTP pyrophosphatase (non-canonical NTP hydrolase)
VKLNEYAEKAKTLSTHGDGAYKEHKVPYLVMALCGEAGEAANLVKKVVREHGMAKATIFFQSTGFMKNHDLRLELGDCLWYIAALAEELGYTLEEIATFNLEKIAERRAK